MITRVTNTEIVALINAQLAAYGKLNMQDKELRSLRLECRPIKNLPILKKAQKL